MNIVPPETLSSKEISQEDRRRRLLNILGDNCTSDAFKNCVREKLKMAQEEIDGERSTDSEVSRLEPYGDINKIVEAYIEAFWSKDKESFELKEGLILEIDRRLKNAEEKLLWEFKMKTTLITALLAIGLSTGLSLVGAGLMERSFFTIKISTIHTIVGVLIPLEIYALVKRVALPRLAKYEIDSEAQLRQMANKELKDYERKIGK